MEVSGQKGDKKMRQLAAEHYHCFVQFSYWLYSLVLWCVEQKLNQKPHQMTLLIHLSLWIRMRFPPQIRASVKDHPELYSQIYTPHPVIVPGGRFRELYYWWVNKGTYHSAVWQLVSSGQRGERSHPDPARGLHWEPSSVLCADTDTSCSVSNRDSYWVINGLLLSEMTDTAHGMIQNFLYLVNRWDSWVPLIFYSPAGCRYFSSIILNKESFSNPSATLWKWRSWGGFQDLWNKRFFFFSPLTLQIWLCSKRWADLLRAAQSASIPHSNGGELLSSNQG